MEPPLKATTIKRTVNTLQIVVSLEDCARRRNRTSHDFTIKFKAQLNNIEPQSVKLLPKIHYGLIYMRQHATLLYVATPIHSVTMLCFISVVCSPPHNNNQVSERNNTQTVWGHDLFALCWLQAGLLVPRNSQPRSRHTRSEITQNNIDIRCHAGNRSHISWLPVGGLIIDSPANVLITDLCIVRDTCFHSKQVAWNTPFGHMHRFSCNTFPTLHNITQHYNALHRMADSYTIVQTHVCCFRRKLSSQTDCVLFGNVMLCLYLFICVVLYVRMQNGGHVRIPCSLPVCSFCAFCFSSQFSLTLNSPSKLKIDSEIGNNLLLALNTHNYFHYNVFCS